MRRDNLDEDLGYRPSEALCLLHNLTFHAALSACPDCREGLS